MGPYIPTLFTKRLTDLQPQDHASKILTATVISRVSPGTVGVVEPDTEQSLELARHGVRTLPGENAFTNILRKLLVKVRRHIEFLDPMKIVYMRASGDYIDFIMSTGEVVHVKEQFTHLEARLPGQLFVRVHRSFIINKEYLTLIKPKQNSYQLILVDETVILSGPSYKKIIQSQFLHSVRHNGRVAKSSPTGTIDYSTIGAENNFKVAPISQSACLHLCTRGDENILSLLGKSTFIETYAGTVSEKDIIEYCAKYNTEKYYRACLNDPQTKTWMILSGVLQAPVGYVVLAPSSIACVNPKPADLEIKHFYLLNRFQNETLKNYVITSIFRYARQMGCGRLLLSEHIYNEGSIRFYEQAGFYRINEYKLRVGSHEYNTIAFALDM
jgi:diamine N-acetyltransferase